MKINVYSIMWNAEMILPYFLRHYSQFANRIFIVDDHSTDQTAQIAKDHPMVTYLPHDGKGLNEDVFNQTFYELYRTNPSDLAIVADQDEFVMEPTMTESGVYSCEGYTMVSKHLPSTDGQIYDELKEGFRTPSWDKPIIFDPKLDVRFGDGRHSVNLPVVKSTTKLLHYKYPSKGYYLSHNMTGYHRIDGMDGDQWSYRLKRGLDNFNKELEIVV
jgi:hypothetical protein